MYSKANINQKQNQTKPTHHGEAEVKQGCPSERVSQAVYELWQDSRDLLAQSKVSDDSHDHHEYYWVLQHLERWRKRDRQNNFKK